MRLAGRVRARGASERGLALMLVLLILLALLVLCAPFLMSSRNASRASAALADRSAAKLLLDAGSNHARVLLSRSHPSTDTTPYYDSLEELHVDSRLDPKFWNTRDAHGGMWDVEAEDVAGKIDWNSAPPEVFANALGAVTRTTDKLKASDTEIAVTSTDGFEPQGFFWLGRELVGYGAIDPTTFKKLTRGVGASKDAAGGWAKCGPQPAIDHDPGETVIDQRAFAHALWRIAKGDGTLRRFEGAEQLADASAQSLTGKFSADALALLRKSGSVYAGVRAGREWQHPVRLSSAATAAVTCEITVDDGRWINPGSTLRIEDGRTLEYALVEEVLGNGRIRLRQPLQSDYLAFEAEVSVLARRPVNVNVASQEVLELVFTNLQLRGFNDRIVRSEARALAELVIHSRPFIGEEDFLRRVVLPASGLERLPSSAPVAPAELAQGSTLISAADALALYANAQNANDAGLAYSTMPLCFTSRDVYELQVRSTINAESGSERVAMVRDEVASYAPQTELLQIWGRQEDFDAALRLDRDAPWWMTGPRSTSHYDGSASPPARLWAHVGTYAGQAFMPGVTPPIKDLDPSATPQAEHIFASREDDGWAQLWPSRVIETKSTTGRMLHFDHPVDDPEGRYLPTEPVLRAPNAPLVGWTQSSTNFARPMSFSLWLKPRALTDGLFLDLGRTSIESDRVTLGIEGADLVLRVYDGAGNHPDTTELDVGEVRYAVAKGNDPGLPADTWTHVAIDVRGTRPDQMSMQVNGKDFGVRTLGLTRLSSAMEQTSASFRVESDEGFPAQGVVRIGDELIEYVKQGKNTFQCSRTEAGASAGTGGRLAREPFGLKLTNGVEPGVNSAIGKVTTHAAGTSVMLYGYSIPLASNVPASSSSLASDLGFFTVGLVDGVVGGKQSNGDSIDVTFNQQSFNLGYGMEGATSQVNGLTLLPADPNLAPGQVFSAFSQNGGYALLVQRSAGSINFGQGGSYNGPVTTMNSPIGGFEIVRYSGYDVGSRTLFISQRNALPVGKLGSGAHAFVSQWSSSLVLANSKTEIQKVLEWRMFVVPISISAPGASGSAGFLVPNGGSEFAQLTHLDQAELTEWFRYDEIRGQDLVRDAPDALNDLGIALIHSLVGNFDANSPPSSGGGPPAPPGVPVNAASPPASSSAQNGGSDWLPYLGQREDDNYPLTRAAREAFQFRGVLGTYSHKHSAGTVILPAFRVQFSDVHGGRPGRLDAAFLMDGDPADPGWPVRVQHVAVPRDYGVSSWKAQPGDPMTPIPGGVGVANHHGFIVQATYVALQHAAPVPMAAGVATSNVPAFETRQWSRLMMHPSGELPREVDKVVLGGSIRGGLIPQATIDEVGFGSTRFGEGSSQGAALSGANLLLAVALGENANSFQLAPHAVRGARGAYAELAANFLDALPKDCGLLRIGDEILAYDSIDISSGLGTIAPNGRGLLGTRPQAHELGETAMLLDSWSVGQLKGAMTASSSSITLSDLADFPSMGTVLIGSELIHFTHQEGSSLAMPRFSKEPGKKDGKGGGIFRGRYGTMPAAHEAGEAVILYPFRYWDRWADRADAPELAYFGLSIDQPSAFFRSMFFKVENADAAGTQLGVLQRLDDATPWDAEPDTTPALSQIWRGTQNDKPIAIGRQADRVEWRVFVKYSKGAYDPTSGLSHGWKQTPRLRVLGANYLAPSQVLRRVDR